MNTLTKIIAILIVIAVIAAVSGKLSNQKKAPVITITQEQIQEATFSGSRPVISGNSSAVDAANAYIADKLATFKTTADKDVPELRTQFGVDAPPSHYTIDFEAKTVSSATTNSVIVSGYVYTGGANGMSEYKVFTTRNSDNALLTLSDVVQPTQTDAFVSYIKEQLLDQSSRGDTVLTVFPEDVAKITASSLDDFSIENDTITFYFDKYEIGPGALGAVAFPVDRSVIEQYLAL